jgi:hypothetical protein
MTQCPRRLVFDQGVTTDPAALDLSPPVGAAVHIHLHVGGSPHIVPPPATAVAPTSEPTGRSGSWLKRPLLLGVAGMIVAVVAFDLGARSGEGHARAIAAARTSVGALAPLAALPPLPQAPPRPGDLPASVQQQLAQRPIVTRPAGADEPAGAPDPFGLQH